MGEIVLACVWVLEGGFIKKAQRLWDRKWPLILVLIYLMHVLGMLYSTDIEFGLHDLRIKLPMLMFPIV